MIEAGNEYNFILTMFGEITLKNIQRKYREELVQTWVPTVALVITTIALIFSIVV